MGRTKMFLPTLVLASLVCLAPGTLAGNATSHWYLVNAVTLNDQVQVTKYKSAQTGLVVVLADLDNPIISGQFCVATEANDDNGLPHTLEHLIFRGSDEYPYSNFLELSAQRSLAGWFNAFTSQTETCYVVSAAGPQGFARISGDFINSMFFPTFSAESFTTQVHHINGKGEDAGVVYSEMQGREKTEWNIIYQSVKQNIFPPGSGFGSNTGGALKNLRENTTIELIRKYHRKAYQLRNTYINVAGNIAPEKVFDMLAPLEEKYLAQESLLPYHRPFQTVYPRLRKNVDKTVKYPSTEEKQGTVKLAWILPYQFWENIQEVQALNYLCKYLSGTPTSPVKEAFVNTKDPLATFASVGTWIMSQPLMIFSAGGVPLDKMDQIEGTFKALIKNITQRGGDKIDLGMLHGILRKEQETHESALESGQTWNLLYSARLDQIYGHSRNDFVTFLSKSQPSRISEFISYPPEFWNSLLSKAFSGHRLLIRAVPSIAEASRLKKQEAERTQRQQERMGEAGMAAAGRVVQAALDNTQKTPEEVLQSVPMAGTDSIKFRHIGFYNYTSQDLPEPFNLKLIPYKFYMADVQSKVIKANLLFSISDFSNEDAAYLPLLTSLWLESALNTTLRGFEAKSQVSKRHLESIMDFSIWSSSETITFSWKMKVDKYSQALALVRDSLHQVQFDSKDALNAVKARKVSLASQKDDGTSVAWTLSSMIYFKDKLLLENDLRKYMEIVQDQILEMERNPDRIMQKLDQLRARIVQPKKAIGYMATSKAHWASLALKELEFGWRHLFQSDAEYPGESCMKTGIHIPRGYQFRDPMPDQPHMIAGMAGSTSCFVYHTVPYDNHDYEAPEQAVVQLMLTYVSRVLFDAIRGKGLAYGISIWPDIDNGRILANFYRSSQLPEGYGLYREVLSNYSKPEYTGWNSVLLDSHRGGSVFSKVAVENSLDSLLGSTFRYLTLPVDDPLLHRRMIHRLAEVTMEQVKLSAQKYLARFLEPDQLTTAVACGEDLVPKIKQVFQGYGLKLEEANLE